MKSVGLYDAKTKLSALIAEIESTGETIQLTRHGKVVAELCPPAPVTSPVRGSLKSNSFYIADDFDEIEIGFEDIYHQQDAAIEPALSKVAEGEAKYITKNSS